MKNVSFNIARKLKHIGYPQIGGDRYNLQGDLFHNVGSADCYGPVAPTYIEALSWLLNEKNITLCESNELYIQQMVNNILGYLEKGDLKDETPTEEPEEEPEEGSYPLTICDTGNGEEEFTTFENEGEMITYFNDNFAAARGKEFETIADCMVWIAESSYLSVALWKEYEVTLSYHQSIIVKTHGFSKNNAIKNAYAADFDNPKECTQLGWQEDGDPFAEEI